MNITEHFKREEFDCEDGTIVPEIYMPNLEFLCHNLECLRDILQKPIIICSGYRTESHNKEVGGKPQSQHLKASAADIKVNFVSPLQLYNLIEKLIQDDIMKQGGLGIYDEIVHYDIRGVKARWDFRSKK